MLLAWILGLTGFRSKDDETLLNKINNLFGKEKKKESKKLLKAINYLNLGCDICLTIMVNVLTGSTPLAITVGCLLVLIRMSEKIMRILFNYRSSKSYEDITIIPKTWSNLFLFFSILVFSCISIATYYINKSATFQAIIDKVGSSGLMTFLLYFVAIWAVITVIISLYPALYHYVQKLNKREGRHYFTEKYFPKSALTDNLSKNTKSNYVKIEPQKLSNPDEFSPYQDTINNKIYLTKCKGKGKEFEKYLLQGIIKNKTGCEEVYAYKIDADDKIIAETSDIKELNYMWSVRAFFRSKKIKIPTTIIDYLTDIPFIYFAIKFAGLNSLITYFLILCLPLGACECVVYNICYFRKDELSQQKITEHKNHKKANVIYYIAISAAYLSAISKIFVKIYPLYHVCLKVTKNHMLAAMFAFTSAFVYMLRNFSNVWYAAPKFQIAVHEKFGGTSTPPITSRKLSKAPLEIV